MVPNMQQRSIFSDRSIQLRQICRYFTILIHETTVVLTRLSTDANPVGCLGLRQVPLTIGSP